MDSTRTIAEGDHGPDVIPPTDECAANYCGRPAVEHGYGDSSEILHPFVQPPRKPNPSRIVEADIETQWTCWACGSDCNVEGVGQGWIDCSTCGAWCWLT